MTFCLVSKQTSSLIETPIGVGQQPQQLGFVK